MSLLGEIGDLVDHVMPGATVVRLRRLGGGLTAATHHVAVDDGGARRDLVLKRYVGGMWEDYGEVATIVHRVLDHVGAQSIPVATALWSDGGSRFGVPALLVTREPGRMRFAPGFSTVGVDDAARALASIHRSAPTSILVASSDGAGPEPASSARALVARVRREWGDDPLGPVVASLLDVDDPVTGRRVLCHGDYHPGNLLWHRSRLSAVLDWDAARVGTPEGDVAWYRLHLWLAGRPDAAARFVRAYEAASAHPTSNLSHWDARAAALAVGRHPFWLPIYRTGGVQVGYGEVRQRLVDFIAHCDR